MKGRNKKPKNTKPLLVLLSVLMILALIVLPVKAAGKNYTPGASNTVASEMQFTFNKDLIIEKDYNIPAATFTFAATPGTAIAYDKNAGTVEVLAGVDCDKITFTPDTVMTDTGAGSLDYPALSKDASTAIADAGITLITATPDSDHYTARKTMKMDFSKVEFTEPGIYRYVITESGTNTAIQNDSVLTRTLDVYVEDASDSTAKKLKISGFVFYKGTVTAAPKTDAKPETDPETQKSEGYENHYPATGLTFGKEVTGNQGSLDKYFEFTLSITNAQPNTVFSVDYSHAESSITAINDATSVSVIASTDLPKSQPPTFAADANGAATQKFYLQDGQYITVYGFVEGTKYELSENAEDYKSIETIAQDVSSLDYDGTSGADALNDPVCGTFTKDVNKKLIPVHTGFTNEKKGSVPTGVILRIAPWACAGIVILAGVVFFALRSRRRFEEE